MISWYVIYSQPHCEIKACENLRRQGYTPYLPRYRRWLRHARKREIVHRPLFPRYLFAGLDRDAMAWRPMLSTFGVAGIVRCGDEPTMVPIGVIETLQRCETHGMFDELTPRQRLKPGDQVRIIAGPFGDLIGCVLEAGDDERVSILLELLGRSVKMKIPAAVLAVA